MSEMKTPKQIAAELITLAYSSLDGSPVVALKPHPLAGRLLLSSGATGLTVLVAQEIVAGVIEDAIRAEREACAREAEVVPANDESQQAANEAANNARSYAAWRIRHRQ